MKVNHRMIIPVLIEDVNDVDATPIDAKGNRSPRLAMREFFLDLLVGLCLSTAFFATVISPEELDELLKQNMVRLNNNLKNKQWMHYLLALLYRALKNFKRRSTFPFALSFSSLLGSSLLGSSHE